MSKKNENYLDYIPQIPSGLHTEKDDEGIVTIDMVHKGFYAFIAQKIFKKPRVSHIKLDKMGSFIIKRIDGVNTVGDIAQQLKEHFGEQAEPLYERLIKYMRILQNNKFIEYKKEEKNK